MAIMKNQSPVLRDLLLVAVLLQSCAFQGCARTTSTASEFPLPLVIMSSADFGYLTSGSRSTARLVKIKNASNTAVDVSRWTVSCECLEIVPSSLLVPPGGATYIRVVFDPTKENDHFVGDLIISVEGFTDDERVCCFDVPVSVVAAEDVTHLVGVGK
jgi:hypothetical protein